MRNPRLIIFAAVTIGAFAGVGSASAADMPARTYTKAPILNSDPSWTGFYVGADIGAASQRDFGTSGFSQSVVGNNVLLGQSGSNTSFIGGGHIGYNWQFARTLVFGFEADIMGLDAKNSFCRGTDNLPTGCVDVGRGFETIQSQTNWLSTVRGRLGATFDRVMVYGTGGVAVGEVKTGLGVNCLVGGCGASGTQVAAGGNSSSTQTGWAAGGGIEWMFASNWTARAEYLHADLGNVTGNFVVPIPGRNVTSLSYSGNLTYDTVRVGVSYKLGGY